MNGYGQTHRNWIDHQGGKLTGPFYCGMSMVMKMTQFAIDLLSPTSTSCQICVALKFSGHEGIVIELNNTTFAKQTRGLDVSWISRFKEEDERYYNSTIISHNIPSTFAYF